MYNCRRNFNHIGTELKGILLFSILNVAFNYIPELWKQW
jgi:hypothetical protein